jgi:tetratricopeptide (TPR) repeat protein
VTTSLVCAVYGGESAAHYRPFVAGWWAAVRRMDPPPAEVVIAHEVPDPVGLSDLPADVPCRVHLVPLSHGASGVEAWNAAVDAANGEWVSAIGVDDEPLPGMFAEIPAAEAAGADVLVGNQVERGSHTWHGRWDAAEQRRANCVPGSSPFRWQRWHKVGGFPLGLRWWDWGFWLLLHKAGCRGHVASVETVVFDPGRGRPTTSGVDLPADVRGAADAEIAAFVRKLWPLRIGIYALCRNEAHHVAAWEESSREADVRVVTDTGSDDGTDRLLRDRGVDVRHGSPVPWRWDDAHNLSLMHLPSDVDVCVRLDLDETLAPGWRQAIEAAWTGDANNLIYRYVYSFNAAGQPQTVFHLDRVHSRNAFRWQMATHEGLCCWLGEKRQKFAPGLEIHHHRDPGKTHKTDLTLLHVAVAEAPHDARARWYLARELDYAGHPAAAAEFADYLAMPGGTPTERSYALRVMARITQQEEYLHRAAAEARNEPDAWERLALARHHVGDHERCLTFALAAIEAKVSTHATDCHAKARAHELASIALWQLGRKPEALPHARAAVAGFPGDERLAANLADMEAACAAPA